MQTLSQFITRISFWVLIAGVSAIILGHFLLFLLKVMGISSALVYLPLIIAGIAKNIGIFCFFALGAKLGLTCLTEILHRDWGIKSVTLTVTSADLRYDALILCGLIAFLVVTYGPVKG